jgi:hypothetical protein
VPRFSRTPCATGTAPRVPGADQAAVLHHWLGLGP